MDTSIVQVLISGSECTILNSTSTQIMCQTGSYAYSSIKALIQVYVKNVGLAINVTFYLSIFKGDNLIFDVND